MASAKPAASRKLSYKERVELDQLPQKIDAMEIEQATLHAKMAEPAYYKLAPAVQQADRARLNELDQMLANSYSRWEELSEFQ